MLGASSRLKRGLCVCASTYYLFTRERGRMGQRREPRSVSWRAGRPGRGRRRRNRWPGRALALIPSLAFGLVLYLLVMCASTAPARSFVGGALALGLLLPFALLLACLALGAAGAAALILAGISILAGAFQLRSAVRQAGMFRTQPG